jgi:heme exporter protein B
MSGWIALLKRDVMLASRLGGGGFAGVIFFLSLVVLAPFALGPDLNLLARVGPALLWIAALLATLIGLDRLFQADEEDGSLDLMRMGDMPMLLVVLAKGIAHWLTTGLPLTLAAPVLGLLLAIEPKVLGVVMLSLVIGTPALTFIGAVGAALTVSVRRGGLLLAVIVMPMMIPVMIFGVATASAAASDMMDFTTPLMVLAGLSLGSIAVASLIAALALSEAS